MGTQQQREGLDEGIMQVYYLKDILHIAVVSGIYIYIWWNVYKFY